MALYKYFTREPSVLPNPDGDLSKHVPPSAIRQANEEVQPLIKEENQAAAKKTRSPYSVFTAEEKATIGKRAAEFGVTNTIHHFKKQFSLIVNSKRVQCVCGPIVISRSFLQEKSKAETRRT